MYVIKIVGSRDFGYYRSDSPYRPVEREQATRVPRKNVDRIVACLRKLGYTPLREKL